jgi:hypothetical protein
MTDGASLFRDESDAISAAWWNGPNGTKVRYCMSILWDANAQGFEYAVYARFPDYGPEDALPWMGLDRRIVRGYQEPQISYRARLIQWADRWPNCGKPTGVLLAARGWILPQLPKMSTVNNTGWWYSYADGLDPMPAGSTSVVPPDRFNGSGNWNWDGLTANWWRAWLIIWSTDTPWATPAPVWGAPGLNWGDSRYSWGFGQPASQFSSLPALVGAWKARHCWYPAIIVSFDNALFDQTQPAGGGVNPDGSFGRWSKIGTVGGKPAYVRARFANARYIDGVA